MPIKHVKAGEQAAIALVKAKNAERATTDESERAMAIVAKIRERYSIQAEEAIMRKAIHSLALGEQPSQEYFDYYDYVEQCKVDVDAEIAAREEIEEAED